ncbi:TonB-dependent receptor [Sinomicrobium sp. FJxs]|uniref:TonB-dependent receptor n=2 Tax=Sinomicrobium weinanense TaxID=2842200 RepID=A0A926JTP7_9FLAO|nr:TonB-dependent receptor [Sinomicrobium weinanense]MBC9797191.1 TonB-dependent receptor [Sinomicrobium weinanense]MBU3122745.1 TonB-dependent receptor [Sinomicrobium weinanense]
MERLIEETDYNFLFDESQLENATLKKDINIGNRPIKDILRDIDRQVPLEYSIEGKNVSLRLVPRAQQQKKGRLNGHVYDDQNAPLPGANMIIEGRPLGTSTGFDGDYDIQLLPGTYTVRVSYISFATQRVTDVVVEAGKTTTLDIVLQPSSETLEEVVVTAQYDRRANNVAALNAIRKNEVTAIDGITAEQIARTPDNDVAQVLTRVTGLHVQDNKYVVVRGVSERYNNVAMNNALMPSTEANRRNYAFDIIPSNLVESVIVHKTASPDLPGEFTGGYVNVNTVEIPSEDFLTIKIGTGGNKNTFDDFYSLPRFKNDYLGLLSSDSKLPVLAHELRKSARAGVNENELVPLSRQMPGNDRFRISRYTQQPTQDYAISLGKTIDLAGDDRLGMTAALTYRNEQTKQAYFEEEPGSRFITGGDRYNFLTRLGGVLNATYAFDTHKISLKNTFYQKLETENTIYNGINLYEGWPVTGVAEERIVNSFGQSTLKGEHSLGQRNAKLGWDLGIAGYTRNQPNNIQYEGRSYSTSFSSADRELVFQEFRNSHPPYDSYVTNRQIESPKDYYSKYGEKRYTAGLNLEIPLSATHNKNKLSAGYSGSIRKTDFDQFRYVISPHGETGTRLSDFAGLPIYRILNQNAFDEELFHYYPQSVGVGGINGLGNGYEGSQDLHAGYLSLDAYLFGKLHFSGGLRVEYNDMRTDTGIRETKKNEDTGEVTISEEPESYTIYETDLLPSANLIYEVTPQMNARASYFRSLARPEFTELGKYTYYDYNLRTVVVSGYGITDEEGNEKLLEQTTVDNFELRWEFYPTPEESFSVSGFYKDFDKPIELQLDNNSGGGTTPLRASFYNLKRATNYGVEIDFRKSFAFLNSTFGENLYLFGNASLIWSDIYYDREQVPVDTGETDEEGNPIYKLTVVEENRPLYGQAPYIVNGGLQYTGAHFGFTASYNRVGSRIVLPSGDPFYHEYEKPRDVLDLQFRYAFLKDNRAEIKLNLADIFNNPIIRYYNNIDPKTKQNRVKIAPNPDGEGHSLSIPLHDPSGKNYDPRYDLVRRRYDRQRSFTLSFKYTF